MQAGWFRDVVKSVNRKWVFVCVCDFLFVCLEFHFIWGKKIFVSRCAILFWFNSIWSTTTRGKCIENLTTTTKSLNKKTSKTNWICNAWKVHTQLLPKNGEILWSHIRYQRSIQWKESKQNGQSMFVLNTRVK